MVDIVDEETRSRMMSGIRSKNTKPEIIVRRALHRLGYRFRLNSKVGITKPDIVLRSHKVAVFIHGCYWHQHLGCKLAYSDRSYSEKWIQKFKNNKLRDERVLNELLSAGWRVVVIWECSTRDPVELISVIQAVSDFIKLPSCKYYESEYKKT